jgi:solute carrier family 25 aspartate/glutamate transporter 12/13
MPNLVWQNGAWASTAISDKSAVVVDHVVPLWAKILAGGFAGMFGSTVVFPLDLIKSRMQAHIVESCGTRRFGGPLHLFRSIRAGEGFVGLFAGLRPALLGVFPGTAVKLAVNDFVGNKFSTSNGNGTISVGQQAISGALAGFCQTAAANPSEVLKIRMQTQGSNFTREIGAIEMMRELGVRGLFRGSFATLLRDVPFCCVFFPLYSHLKYTWDGSGNNLLGLFGAGAVASSISAGLVTPFDVVKTVRHTVVIRGQYAHTECLTFASFVAFASVWWRNKVQRGTGCFCEDCTQRTLISTHERGRTAYVYYCSNVWMHAT